MQTPSATPPPDFFFFFFGVGVRAILVADLNLNGLTYSQALFLVTQRFAHLKPWLWQFVLFFVCLFVFKEDTQEVDKQTNNNKTKISHYFCYGSLPQEVVCAHYRKRATFRRALRMGGGGRPRFVLGDFWTLSPAHETVSNIHTEECKKFFLRRKICMLSAHKMEPTWKERFKTSLVSTSQVCRGFALSYTRVPDGEVLLTQKLSFALQTR